MSKPVDVLILHGKSVPLVTYLKELLLWKRDSSQTTLNFRPLERGNLTRLP
jgi:hypothetical protein